MHVKVTKRHCSIPHLRQALLLFQNKQHNCFLYLKICNLLFDQPGKPRLKSYVNRCHIRVGTHKFRSAVLVSGVPFRNQRQRNLNMFCRVNQVNRAQNCRPVYQNKCVYRLLKQKSLRECQLKLIILLFFHERECENRFSPIRKNSKILNPGENL